MDCDKDKKRGLQEVPTVPFEKTRDREPVGPRSLIIAIADGSIRQNYVGTPSLPAFHHQHQKPKNCDGLLNTHCLLLIDSVRFIPRR